MVVIGAGPNGLVAANLLADAGREVVVLEAQAEPGGAVKSGEVTIPGYRHDLFSAFYPLAAVSPAFEALDLESHGLRWRRSSVPLAHVFADGRAAAISLDVDATAESVDGFARGDGDAWRRLLGDWLAVSEPLMEALLSPFPPIAPALRLLGRLRRPRTVMDLVRTTLLPVRRLAAERFDGEGAAMLLAGNTLHTDLSPDSTLGGFYGWMLAMLAQTVGMPVPEGGAGCLTDALVRRLESRGAHLRCGARVERVLVRNGRVTGIRLASGEEVSAGVVLADVVAPTLYLDLVGTEHLPARFRAELDRFELDHGTVKVDWALRAPIAWTDPVARQAGTLHLGEGMDHLTRFASDLSAGDLPRSPFVLFGQMSRADTTRSPAGTETAWAYTHVPNVRRTKAGLESDQVAKVVRGMEEVVECRAPGFRDLVVGRHVFGPADLEEADANLLGGSINAGTAQLHQQLVFRPVPGLAGPNTPIGGLYLASASAHPGGGVHGACGANAARAAMRHRP